MTSIQRFSYGIQAVPDETRLIEHLKHLKPNSIGVIDNPALLINILNAVPEIQIGWHRFTEKGEAELWIDDANYWQLIQAFKDSGLRSHPRAWLYVMNEPKTAGKDSIERMVGWMCRAMDACKANNIKAIVGNLGVAVYEKRDIDAGYFDSWLHKLHDYRDTMMAGFHEYQPPILPMGAAGRTTNPAYLTDVKLAQKEHWPSPWDVQASNRQNGSLESNYFLGRCYWWDERANHIGVRPPRKAITEFGPDDLKGKDQTLNGAYDEIGKKYPPAPHLNIRGWNSLKRYYAAMFPQWTFEQAIMAQLEHINWVYDDTIFRNQTVPSIECVNLFVWTTPEKEDWAKAYGFDLSQNFELHTLMEKWQPVIQGDQPPVEPPPPPTNPDPPTPPTEPPPPAAELSKLHEQLMSYNANLADLDDEAGEIARRRSRIYSAMADVYRQIETLSKAQAKAA